MKSLKKLLTCLAALVLFLAILLGGAVSDRLFGYRILDRFFPRSDQASFRTATQTILKEESVVIDVAERASPSVVTVSVTRRQQALNLFDPFNFFGQPQQTQPEAQDIGSGFIIDKNGLIVTNKHVVSVSAASYKVITKDDKEYEVTKIYRDPTNDLAILKIDATNLTPVELGNSDNLKVGQFVIAIGTALGEFRHTVTTGVISGLGRGITAGSPLEGFVERLDNVIQTDAAINPGNSGGPLLNSAGQVIGVNVAVAGEAQNVGFALPINVVKEVITNFNQTGQFERAFLGVRYRMISKEAALANEVPEGAYVVEVVQDSPAARGGVRVEDIITHFDGKRIADEEGGLAKLISQKKAGETVEITVWRSREEKKLRVTLLASD